MLPENNAAKLTPEISRSRKLSRPVVKSASTFTQSLNENQVRRERLNDIDRETLKQTSKFSGIIRQLSFRNKNQSMRKSRTEPSFSSFSSTAHSSDFGDADSSGFEDEDSNSDDFEENNTAPIEFPGIALPNDLQAFLHVTTVGAGKNLTWTPIARRKETYAQVHQGKSLKRSLASHVVSS